MDIILGGKKLGTVYKEQNLFYKEVSKKKHLFKKLNAWGIDTRVFEKLLSKNYKVAVYDRDTKTYYWQFAEQIKLNGSFLHFKGKEDYGTQIFLPLKMWNTCHGKFW